MARQMTPMELEAAKQAPLVGAEARGGDASELALTLNLVTACLGCGILSLPWTAAGASIITGAAITAAVLAVNAWTMILLTEAAEKYQVFDLGAVMSRIPGLGPASQIVCNVIIWVIQFMCLIGCMIIIADSEISLSDGSLVDNRTLLVVLGSLLVLPLCYLDQKYLAFSSTLSIAVNIYLIVLVSYYALFQPWTGKPACLLGVSTGSVSMCSALMMAVAIQMCVLPMYQSLEQRTVPKFRRVITRSFSVVFLLFVGFQTLALVAFGPDVASNVLRTLPNTFAGSLARVGMLISVLGLYPLMLEPMIVPVTSAFGAGPGHAATVAVVAAAMFAAFGCSDLGIMNVLNGAVSVAFFVGASPALVGYYLLGKSPVLMGLLAAAGAVLGALGGVLTENYIEAVEASCLF